MAAISSCARSATYKGLPYGDIGYVGVAGRHDHDQQRPCGPAGTTDQAARGCPAKSSIQWAGEGGSGFQVRRGVR